MELSAPLSAGLGAALTAGNVALAAGGAVLGSLALALPRLGPVVMLALLLPVVQALPVLSALILLTGVVIGSHHRMGIATKAATFVSACLGVLLVAVLLQPLTDVANRLGPAEWVALVVLTLVCTVALTADSLLRGLGMVLLGLLLAQVGSDPASGLVRYTFGIAALNQGVPLLALAVGLYAVGPAIVALRAEPLPSAMAGASLPAPAAPMPSRWRLWLDKVPMAVRRTGPPSLHPVGAAAALLPLFSFGLPLNAPLALLFSAMALKGLRPGPEVGPTAPGLLWGVLASLWVGCSVLLLLQLPALRFRALRQWLSRHAERHVVAVVVVLASMGLYTLGGGRFALWLGAGIGVLSVVFHRLGCPVTPLFVAFLLAPALKANLGRALLLSGGDWSTFATRPVASALLLASALLIAVALLPPVRKRRRLRFSQR